MTKIIPFRAPAAGAQSDHSSVDAAVVDLETRRESRLQGSDRERLTLGDIWDALEEERICLHYQPQFDPQTGRVTGAEALVRLLDRDGALIMPGRFIDLTEDSDLIVPLGRTVIARAAGDLASLRAVGAGLPRVSINLAPHQLEADSSLAEFVARVLDNTGLSPADLEFELTERQRLDKTGSGMTQLRALAERGHRITVDDFGVGHTSVLDLAELPISAFKLDRAFTSRLLDEPGLQHVVRALLDMAARLELGVVAEGVETQAQHDWLVQAGCPRVQGFHYARPASVGILQALLIRRGGGARAGRARHASEVEQEAELS